VQALAELAQGYLELLGYAAQAREHAREGRMLANRARAVSMGHDGAASDTSGSDDDVAAAARWRARLAFVQGAAELSLGLLGDAEKHLLLAEAALREPDAVEDPLLERQLATRFGDLVPYRDLLAGGPVVSRSILTRPLYRH
jgi:hypothetical protein